MDIKRLVFRKFNANDLDLFIKLRIDFLKEMHSDITAADEKKIIGSLKLYYKKFLKRNEFTGIVCEHNGKAISTAYLAICEKPANHNFTDGKEGTLLNVYTYPEYRKTGIATEVIKKVIEEARKLNLSVIALTATKDGEGIYKKLGFEEYENKAMNLKL